jgi:hypothetical protein
MFLLVMSVIFEINRDFRYQVELSFDEIAMEVLARLDERSFDWMYVDLPARAVRYCFRTPADATAFKLRFAHAVERRIVGG